MRKIVACFFALSLIFASCSQNVTSSQPPNPLLNNWTRGYNDAEEHQVHVMVSFKPDTWRIKGFASDTFLIQVIKYNNKTTILSYYIFTYTFDDNNIYAALINAFDDNDNNAQEKYQGKKLTIPYSIKTIQTQIDETQILVLTLEGNTFEYKKYQY